ncbi:hypothetical protein FNB15_05800 [Ferrovibrio terrae]|uniref:Uncharacterized protein n=1 Tax=Ferrovibrio terrae TaxID=2594003 RepID=A0A516GZ73_9PROT|nr:hypothetical protein [Ferrovibrio terrae]QDO96818.1 hypothetical protein FNB15_05800 [Ferrovibrio terrae]
MKTDLLVFAGTVLLFASLPMVSRAEDGEDWAAHSPLAMGEPMEDCDIHHHGAVIALDVVPGPPADKVEAILTTPDVVPAVAPVTTPAVIAPVKAPAGATTQATPKHLSPATLLTFALIASPGTALPQTSGSGRE